MNNSLTKERKPDFVFSAELVYDIILDIKENNECYKLPANNLHGQFNNFFHMYPRGIDDESKDFISLYLSFPANSAIRKTKAIFKFIIHATNDSSKSTEIYRNETDIVEPSVVDKIGIKKFKLRNTIWDRRATTSILKLTCEVYSVPDGSCPKTSSSEADKSNAISGLVTDLSNLYTRMKFSDVTFIVAEQKIQAHKAILAARSVVFEAMFEHDMAESKSNCIDIVDIKPEVLKEMLNFIYTGEAPNKKTMAFDLFAAANKYALKDLQFMCDHEICFNISVETAAETLIFADLYNLDELKKQTINFIITNIHKVMETEDWKILVNTNANLMAEILQAFAIKYVPK